MNSKLLGTAVGVALENHEAIRQAGAPAINAAGGALQVIFRTFWKSIAVGAGLLLVWFVTYVSTYILTGTNVVGSPGVMMLFGVFLFLVMPSIILIREANKVSKAVAAKNKAQREAVQAQQDAQAAEHARAMEAWQASQQNAPTQALPYQPQYR